jgi:hypothetical protein
MTCLPGAIKGTFGYDPFIEACWITLEDPKARVVWAMGTTYCWTILSAGVTAICTAILLARVLWTSNRVRSAFNGSDDTLPDSVIKRGMLRSVTLRILPHPIFLSLSLAFLLHFKANLNSLQLSATLSWFLATSLSRLILMTMMPAEHRFCLRSIRYFSPLLLSSSPLSFFSTSTFLFPTLSLWDLTPTVP